MLRVNAINRQELLKCLTFNPKTLVFKTVSVPVFLIIVGHYAHSTVIPPNGLWFSIKHPKIPSMYESLLAGSDPVCDSPEESAILRYLEELIVE